MDVPVLRTERLTLRPLTDADVDGLVALVAEPSVARWWGPTEDGAKLADDLRAEGKAFAVEADGALAGWLDFWEEDEPDYRYAGLDIVLGTAFQDRGLGSEALRAAIAWLIAGRGHRRFTIDPAVGNARAIRAYEAVGFRPVGVMREYERGADGAWHDNLLMDLLATDL